MCPHEWPVVPGNRWPFPARAIRTNVNEEKAKAEAKMGASIKDIEVLIHAGEIGTALAALGSLAAGSAGNVRQCQKLAEFYTYLGLHQAAYDLYAFARVSQKNDPALLYNSATAAIALGRFDEAEAWLNEAIARNPGDYDAYYNRSTLRRWTADDNHIAEMEGLLKAGIPDRKGAVQLFYALAKEYEDLGQPGPAFEHLERGANLRASMLAYSVDGDVATMEAIEQAFSAEVLKTVSPPNAEPGPIFIVGLPRTGTTLVDRILSAHSKVDSLGEIPDFATAMVRLSGKAASKEALIEATTKLDFDALQKAYTHSTCGRGSNAAYLVDKTPANFLYIGLIAMAMPNARIIHLKRGPMDSCYAIYKTLFRMGYPYSYRQTDLADYYTAYAKLMKHWHSVLPGRIRDVSYEALVGDFEPQVRRLLAHCDLEFEPGCLAFHKSSAPSATASAAQVREPVHSRSVGRWRDYADQLTPLSLRLERHGIKADEAAA